MNEYKIIASAIDFGNMDDGKKWEGLRLFVQEIRKDKKGAVVGMLSKVVKANTDIDIRYDVTCRLLFDERGKVAFIDYGSSK